VLVLAAVTASAALGVQAPPIRFQPTSGPIGSVTSDKPGLTVTVSDHRAGAKQVTVTLRFTGPLRCGRPMGATVVLPSAVGVGAQPAVVLNGKRGSVVKQGHSLKVSSTSSGITCDSIVEGPVTLQVSGLTNPAKAGTYVLKVASAGGTYAGTFTVQ
jgi:hypothetical protein